MTERQRDMTTVFSAMVITFILTSMIGAIVVVIMVLGMSTGFLLYQFVTSPQRVDPNEEQEVHDE